MIDTPLVSVVIRTFNQPKEMLELTLNSIVNQTYQNWELIITDDSSSEDTKGVIDSFCSTERRARVIRKPQRMRLVGAMNIGIKECKGDYIAILDADDIALPERFDKQLTYFGAHPECDILGGAMNIINDKSEITSVRYYPEKGLKLLLWMIFRDPVGHPAVMFRRKVFDKGFYYDESMNSGCEDTEFWFRLRNNGFRIMNIQEPIVNYRVAEDMASKREKDNITNYNARKKNFSWKYCIFDVLSLISIRIRMHIPYSFVSWCYSKENKQKY